MGGSTYAQDNCASAVTLCAGSSRNSTTVGATTVGSDPALSCGDAVVNNSVWFAILAVNNGNCTVTVININNNPGLDMQAYTGTCGSLVSTGFCASGSSATGGTMTMSFPTVSGITYYIMVDGNAGNQEAFDITATTPNDAVVARPDANFDVDPVSGCAPLNVLLDNTTTLHGGTNITYDWKIDAAAYIPSSGVDSTILLNTIGTHTVTLRVCNQQCGCKTVSQDIDVLNLFPSISYLPASSCIGTPIQFNGAAIILPDPPTVNPNITSWDWDFGDPASGASNTANGQSVNHTFTNTSSSYSVSLTIQGLCGPKTVTTVINLRPKPIVTITGGMDICEGQNLNLGSTLSNATAPITYNWVGAGTYSCTNCPATVISNLLVGGPYSIALSIVDFNGCSADTFVDVTVNELPTVFAGGFLTVCPNDSAALNATASNGIAPYHYQWSPSAGLSNDTIFDPYTFNTNSVSYCITVTDVNGCVSLPDCIIIDQYPTPTIVPSSANLCASQLPLQNTFNVNGSGAGSQYEWGLSPDYALITGAAPDSSSIDASFPPVPATYNFIAIVTDGVTGCVDTVPTSFTVTAGLSMSVSGPSTICSGDSATLNVTGATTYSWTATPAYAFADSTNSVQVVFPAVNTIFTITGTMGTCTQTINHSLTVGANPVAFINPIAPVCSCGVVTLDGTGSTPGMTYLWTSQNGSSIVAPGNIVTNGTVCVNDSITLTVTDPSTSCKNSVKEAAVSRPKPVSKANVTPPLICNGVATAINLDGSLSDPGMTYAWTSNTGAVITDSTQMSTTSNVSAATIFSLTVTDAFGCDSTSSSTVNIYPPPTFAANPPFLCTSDPVLQSTLTVSGATPGSTFTWTAIPGCVVPNSAITESQVFDFGTCGTGVYNFDVTVNDIGTTCITNLSQIVTVVSGVVLTVSNDTTFCEGGVATLTASGANSFLWSTGDTTNSITLSGLTAASSPYQYIVIGTIGGCVNSDTIIVTVNPIPNTAIVSADTSVCENDPAVIYSVTPGGANYTWAISGGVIIVGQGSSDVIVNWNSPGLGQLTVYETNSFGCDGPTLMINVIINASPFAPVITGLDTVCRDEYATYFIIPNAGSTYTWSVTGGASITGLSGSVNTIHWGASGTGTVNVYETTAAGCDGPSTSNSIYIKPRPSPVSVSGSMLVCDIVPEIYTVNPNPGSTYTWTVVNDFQHNVSPTMDTLFVNWASGSTFGMISFFETNSVGCNSDTGSINISISIHPQVFIPNDSDSICNNIPYQIISNASPSRLKWFTDGAGSFSNDTIASPMYYPAATDTGYIHFMIVASSSPCLDDTARFSLYLLESPIVTVTGPPGPICYGSSDSLRATGGGTYLWTPGGIPGPVIGIRPLITTTYTVAVTNTLNCTTRDSITVNVIPPGIPDASSDQIICSGDSALLNGSQQNATGVVWHSFGDGTFSPDSIMANAYYISGVADTVAGSVMLMITSTGACLNLTDTMIINFLYHSSIAAGNDTTLMSGNNAVVSVPLSPVAISVSGVIWTSSGTGTFSPSDTTLNPVYTPSKADMALDSVILTVTTTNSCIPVSDYLVVDFSPIIIPNVFTPYPASPGYNDYFVIQYLTPNTQLKIWDRWGNLVYTSDYYQNDWDAHGLQSEVYYYLVITEEKKYKGWVQVLR